MERRGLNIRKGFLKAVLPVFRTLPLPVASRFVSGIGRLEYRLSHELRQSFDEAVAQGRSVLDCQWDVRAVSRELAGNHVLWRTRDLLLDGVPDQRARDMFTVTGREHLDAAYRARAKGASCWRTTSEPISCRLTGCSARTFPSGSTWNVRGISRGSCRGISTRTGRSDRTSSSSRGRAYRPIRPARSCVPRERSRPGMLLYLAGDVRWTGG